MPKKRTSPIPPKDRQEKPTRTEEVAKTVDRRHTQTREKILGDNVDTAWPSQGDSGESPKKKE